MGNVRRRPSSRLVRDLRLRLHAGLGPRSHCAPYSQSSLSAGLMENAKPCLCLMPVLGTSLTEVETHALRKYGRTWVRGAVGLQRKNVCRHDPDCKCRFQLSPGTAYCLLS